MYDKAVNRKANVHFNPRQTMDYLTNNLSNADLTYDAKRRIVRQYLDVRFATHPIIVYMIFEMRIPTEIIL